MAANGNYVTYANDQKYFWMADTAWTATAETSLSTWQSYVDDRANKGFTTVLLAPSLAWTGPALPPALGYSFEQVTSSCGNSNIPNNCSRWKPSYWQKVDQMVGYANSKGIVVTMVAMMDPVNVEQYPSQANAVIFARNFAARLAGNFVIFSPGFDIKLDAAPTIESTMNAVGDALNGTGSLAGAVPRHLIGNHLGGGSPISDYQKFQSKAWLDFHPFQSGHGGGCSGLSNWECAMKRAREAPITIGGYTPIKPRGNAEGPYDDTPGQQGTPPDNRYGTRHGAYLSALSGAFGVTYGLKPIYQWDSPLNYLNPAPASTQDYKRLGDWFRAAPWYDLKPQHGWIINQSTNEVKKMALAVTGNSGFALAYSPDNPTLEIRTSGAAGTYYPGLSCLSPWTITWRNPSTGGTGAGSCSAPPGKVVLARPGCSGGGNIGDCDWLIEIKNTSVPFPSALNSALASTEMQIWSEPSESDLTSLIRASVVDLNGKPIRQLIDVSEHLDAFARLPVVTRDPSGNFWTAWEANSGDTDQFDIYARRFDAQGAPLLSSFRVNASTSDNQYEPSLATDGVGLLAAAWTSYGDDGDAGGIALRRFSSAGVPLGPEEFVNAETKGHQHSPRIAAAPGGALVVAWESGREGAGQRVVAQRLNDKGKRFGPLLRVPTNPGTDSYLSALSIGPTGEAKLTYTVHDSFGRTQGNVLATFDANGNLMSVGPQ